ncbi:MAG: hypothetical protein SFY70_07315 [Bacteroidia bacterium]|nr:hypothetical protein [Bacteroidia bacterium]
MTFGTAMELDLAQVEHPDWFISRLLSSFEHLQGPTAGVAWRLTGTELLGENTQRLLAPVVGKR